MGTEVKGTVVYVLFMLHNKSPLTEWLHATCLYNMLYRAQDSGYRRYQSCIQGDHNPPPHLEAQVGNHLPIDPT